MKVLILTTALSGNCYNGCGWIGACIEYLSQISDIQLGIGYLGSPINSDKQNVSFFPIQVWSNRLNCLKRRVRFEFDEKIVLSEAVKVIDAFHPDIIHVFGSETPFGLISTCTNVPVLIHLQGFQPSYYNAKYPPGVSFRNIFFSLFFHNPWYAFNFWWRDKMYHHCVKREFSVIKSGQYFCGRTEWDYAIIDVIHPQASYFYCSEFLRQPFYDNAGKWMPTVGRKKLKLISVSSPATFKGCDVILKTARWLHEFTDIEFEWNIFGISSTCWNDSFWGYLTTNHHVKACGTASAEEIVRACLESDIFIHTSYIDNSPNSICEAQLLGMPAIGSNVGGVSSIIQDGIDGLLVSANDPLMLAKKIKNLYANPQWAYSLGKQAFITAQKRHAPENIVTVLFKIYKDIVLLQNES